jgi:hypothetical protein
MNIPALNHPLFFSATYPPHRAWKFWLLWVSFTMVGCGLGVLIVPAEQPLLTPYLVGGAVGALQGSLLRLGPSGAVRWTLATVLGIVVSSMIRPYVAFHSSLLASGAVGGIVIGGIQGIVFYTQIPGMAWWVLMQLISGTVSWGLAWSILTRVTDTIGQTATGKVLASPIAQALIWGISAAMTGLVMYRLLTLRRKPRPPLQPPAA